MSLKPVATYGGRKLEPIVSPQMAEFGPVRWAANLTVKAGTAVGQITTGVSAGQTLTITGTPTAGYLLLGYKGFYMTDVTLLTYAVLVGTQAAAELAIKNALEALPSIGVGNIASVARTGLTPNFLFLVTFGGTLATSPQQLLEVGTMALTGGTAAAAFSNTTTGIFPGAFQPALAAAGDGSNTPRGLSKFDITTDANGMVTLGDGTAGMDHGEKYEDAPIYDRGTFKVGDLVGLAGLALPTSWMYTSGSASDPEGWLRIG